jgi:glycosyl transferase family 25
MIDRGQATAIRDTNPTPAGRALLETFSVIRIINLRMRDDRRREMISEFARLGILIGGEKVKFYEASRFSDAAPFPSIGAKGCYHSHMNILEAAHAQNTESLLILEDDCDFIGNIEAAFLHAMEALQSRDWDLFFGGHEDLACDETSLEPIQQIEPGTWIRGTHFVAFRKRAIQALVPFLRDELDVLARDPVGGSRGIDAAYTHFGRQTTGYKYFVAWPKLGYQRPSRSDIESRSAFDEIPLLNSLVKPARRIKRLLKKRLT